MTLIKTEAPVNFKVDRPAVPREVVRRLLVEVGHRCAVCGEPCPLEMAHIIPWRVSKAHDIEDLICLCANCHERADKEKWGQETLREYKYNPWVLRRHSGREEPSASKRVEVTLALDLISFTELDERLIIFALAAFLDIPTTRIRIASVEEGSIRLTLELPRKAANQLLEASKTGSEELSDLLEGLSVQSISWPDHFDLIGIKAERSGEDNVVLEFAPLPPGLLEEDLVEVALLFGKPKSVSASKDPVFERSYLRITVSLDTSKRMVYFLLEHSFCGREFRVYRSAVDFLNLEVPDDRVILVAAELLRPTLTNPGLGARALRMDSKKAIA